MKKVSLYIPCYNAKRFIKECLESIFRQKYPIDEVLIIDDGSTDDTVDICSQYPVRIISHRENKGLAASRNTAFREASNEFVASLDADCVLKPDWLEQLMESFVNDKVAGTGGMLVERYTLRVADKWRLAHMSQHWGNELIANPPFLYGSNTVFKKNAIRSVGFYNENFRNNYEDVELSMRLSEAGFSLIYNPKAVAEHLRKDTVRSVLAAYWQWDYYAYMNPNTINKMLRRLSLCVGKIAYLSETVGQFFREDWERKNYLLLPIDFILLFYYPWLNFKFCLNCNRFMRK